MTELEDEEQAKIERMAEAVSKAVAKLNLNNNASSTDTTRKEAEKFKCPTCNSEVSAMTRYCPNCGEELEWEA